MKTTKTVLKVNESLPLTFTLSKKRMKTTSNLKNKSGFNYSMDLDLKQTKENFKNLTQKLPQKSGYLILLASIDSKNFKTIKLIKSSSNLKDAFFENLTFSQTFTYYLNMLQTNNYSSIKLLVASNY
jgi:hypothetical protein